MTGSETELLGVLQKDMTIYGRSAQELSERWRAGPRRSSYDGGTYEVSREPRRTSRNGHRRDLADEASRVTIHSFAAPFPLAMIAPRPPRRSVLFMPASNVRALQKARQLPADAVIFDLEDAVAPDAKAQAREQACAHVRDGGYGSREVLVRINRLDTAWGHEDLAAVAAVPVAGVVLPKVDHAGPAEECVQRLRALGSQAPVWPMIESPAGVLQVEAIAATSGLGALVMGTNDLLKDLGAIDHGDRRALLYALSRTVAAARAFGLGVLDGVTPSFDDLDALRQVCLQGRELGFDGKTLIHPRQIEPANAAFGPSADEVARARQWVAAWEAAGPAPGVIAVEGEMIEALHIEQARRVLALARTLALPH